MKQNLLIWGTGGHAHVVVESCRYGSYRMIDDNSQEYKDDSWINLFPKEQWDTFIAIGDNKTRELITNRLRAKDYQQTNIISRDSYLSPTVQLGTGIYIAPMATVMTHTILGDGCIINTNSSVDHDCHIGPYTHVSPCACLGGNVTTFERVWIGLGSSINHKVIIQDDIIVAGGSSVIDNLSQPKSLYAGNPAVYKKELTNA